MLLQKMLRVTQKIKILHPYNRSLQGLNRQNMVFIANKSLETNKIGINKRSMSVHHTGAVKEDSLVKKILKSIPFININKTKMKAIAYEHYEVLVDEINHVEFFDELDLPDTFYSWFVVTELHLWMLSVRAMANENEGRFIRNNVVEALWIDVAQRAKKLGAANPSDTRARIAELSEQLQATFIAYDEGLQAEDVVLAGALWRRFYQQEYVDLQHLELLIKYIRKNMRVLEGLTDEEFLDPKKIKWKPLIG